MSEKSERYVTNNFCLIVHINNIIPSESHTKWPQICSNDCLNVFEIEVSLSFWNFLHFGNHLVCPNVYHYLYFIMLLINKKVYTMTLVLRAFLWSVGDPDYLHEQKER